MKRFLDAAEIFNFKLHNVPGSTKFKRLVEYINRRVLRAHRENQKLNLSADYADFRRFKKLILRANHVKLFQGRQKFEII
jgi:hypothetical protein